MDSWIEKPMHPYKRRRIYETHRELFTLGLQSRVLLLNHASQLSNELLLLLQLHLDVISTGGPSPLGGPTFFFLLMGSLL